MLYICVISSTLISIVSASRKCKNVAIFFFLILFSPFLNWPLTKLNNQWLDITHLHNLSILDTFLVQALHIFLPITTTKNFKPAIIFLHNLIYKCPSLKTLKLCHSEPLTLETDRIAVQKGICTNHMYE